MAMFQIEPELRKSRTIQEYRDVTKRLVLLTCPQFSSEEVDMALDYSINKRFTNSPASVYNNYLDYEGNENKEIQLNLLNLTDYIYRREPVLTAYGVLFKKRGEVENPLGKVVAQFLIDRGIYKKEMFKYPKGSDDFMKFNLLQLLEKLNANAIYGVLGQYSSIVYNLHVAPTITTQARLFISSAGMFFESFLANNVKFGNLNEVMQFIDHIMQEKHTRKYNDKDILDNDVHLIDVFTQLVLTCGFIPTKSEQDILWNTLMNIEQEDLNRIYYKNNLYEFFSNSSMKKALKYILRQLNQPYLNPNKPPKEIKVELDTLVDIVKEYVYYGYAYIDRIDRMDNMIKSVCVLSDTDSAIISLDPWYRFVLNEVVEGEDLKIMHQAVNALEFIKFDEFGDVEDLNDIAGLIEYEDDLDFDFWDDQIIAQKKLIDPFIEIPQEGTRYSIINLMAYMLDKLANDYILKVTKVTNSYIGDDDCKMYIKNEFLFKRALLTAVKKHYATIQEIQEGNYVPKEEQLDIKGIDSLKKSTTSKATQDAMKLILENDILLSPDLNQLKIIKKMAILEKQIIDSIKSGSKEYYKPAIVKAASHYVDPMRIQGIKASMVWNEVKPSDVKGLDLTERNSISVAKITFNEKTISKIKEINEEVYENAMNLLMKKSKNEYAWSPTVEFNCIAIPEDADVPDWVMPLIDTTTIVNDGIGGFPLESVGIQRMEKNSINYTNIVQL